MTRRGWVALTIALIAAEAVAVPFGQWIAVGILSSALTGLAALRTGWLWAWRAADEHYRAQTAALHVQLDNDERELSDRRELDHARIRDGGPWPTNDAYRSRGGAYDSPAQPGAELPKQGVR